MKTLYHIFFILVLSAVPYSLFGQRSVYSFPFENSYRLPSMRTFINREDIANTYQTMGNIYTTEITGLGNEPMKQTSMTFISDARVVDGSKCTKKGPNGPLICIGLVYIFKPTINKNQ